MLNLLHNYRGQIQGIVSQGTQSFFITRHSEQQATALYKLDTSTANTQLKALELPCGANAITASSQQVYVAGTDGLLYQTAWDKTKVQTLGNLSFADSPVLGYRSDVMYIDLNTLVATGTSGTDISTDGGKNWKNISTKSVKERSIRLQWWILSLLRMP